MPCLRDGISLDWRSSERQPPCYRLTSLPWRVSRPDACFDALATGAGPVCPLQAIDAGFVLRTAR